MPIPELSIIGESINDSVPSTQALFDANDFGALAALAKSQDEGGAAYIDVNVGARSGEYLAEIIQVVQNATAKPLSIDTPDPAMAEMGLKAYSGAGGKPILNSISPLRTEMFDLVKIQPFRPILLICENEVNGIATPCHTAEETYAAAKFLLQKAKEAGIPTTDCIFDPGVAPIGSDSEGNLKRLVDAMRMIHEDPEFAGYHASVGLSNFTVMLPVRTASGELVKGPLESAFLTLTLPLGMDHVIGSVKRNYNLLPADHPAMRCLEDCIRLGGFDAIMRVMEFYSS